jgi:predicted SAM-dependent methyltransferase
MKLLKTFRFFGFQLELFKGNNKDTKIKDKTSGNFFLDNIKLNFGPGPSWIKPDSTWYSIDIDSGLGDIVLNFQSFERLPLHDDSVVCVYGSHVFEHISIFKSQIVFNEIYRVLKENGILRLVIPDVEKSIKEYVVRNNEYKLFQRRKERAKERYGLEYTLFQCLKEDFLSRTGQNHLLGEYALAHQNAWDYESIVKDLQIAGFQTRKIKKMNYQISQCDYFSFEGVFPSEADEDYRSLYIEAIK